MWRSPSPDRLAALWPLVRDVIIVVTALGLLAFEAMFHSGDVREPLVLAYVGLLATPVFLRGDAKDRSNGNQPAPPPPEPREAER